MSMTPICQTYRSLVRSIGQTLSHKSTYPQLSAHSSLRNAFCPLCIHCPLLLFLSLSFSVCVFVSFLYLRSLSLSLSVSVSVCLSVSLSLSLSLCLSVSLSQQRISLF